MVRQPIRLRPSAVAARLVHIPIAGQTVRMAFADRRYLLPIYNSGHPYTLLRCSRQVEKSTTLANLALTWASVIPRFRAMIIHPTAGQSKSFSQDRLATVIDHSPLLRPLFPVSRQSIFHKRMTSGSSMIMCSAYLSASSTRGKTADLLIIDEIQSILAELIPVLEQVNFHSPYKQFLYSGTPLDDENVIEKYWREYSTQNEWVVPCRRQGTPKNPSSWRWNVLGPKSVGKVGVVCDKCGHPIDPADPACRWVKMADPRGREEKVRWQGFRVNQLMMSFITQPLHWQELRRKMVEYPPAELANEVFGLPHSHGQLPITTQQVVDACDPAVRFGQLDSLLAQANGRVYVGLDWGTAEGKSFTALVVGGYLGTDPRFRMLAAHRFVGGDADAEVALEKILQAIAYVKARHVGPDYGGGHYQNNVLLKRLGRQKVHLFQYIGRQRLGKISPVQKMGVYMVSRSEVMADVFTALKTGMMKLANWDDLVAKDYAHDFLSTRMVYNPRLRYTQYFRQSSKPDDLFHAYLYCFLASLFDIPRPDILTPRPPDELGQDLDAWKEMHEEFGGWNLGM